MSSETPNESRLKDRRMYLAKYMESNGEEVRRKNAEASRLYRKNNPDKHRKAVFLSSYKQATEKDYQHYLATTHCECCGYEFANSKERHQHHDHNTGQLKGVWCKFCNQSEGLLQTPERTYKLACKMAEEIPLMQLIEQATKGTQ